MRCSDGRCADGSYMMPETVLQALNRGLAHVLDQDPRAIVMGEDIEDPYGGAFGVTRGLSTRYPGRVRNCPISEAAIAGMAAGCALTGRPVVVEIMFCDFSALTFDAIANTWSKIPSMFGRHVELPALLRMPTGAGRGYGPTHSQSLQKHFIGLPNLAIYELSQFHDPAALLCHIMAERSPAMLFEDKLLYRAPLVAPGPALAAHDVQVIGDAPGTAWCHVPGTERSDFCFITPGSTAPKVVEAATEALRRSDIVADVAVPARLYPLDVAALASIAGRAQRTVVVEEGLPGSSWGSEVAYRLTEALWPLRHPVRLVNSRLSIIPSARHLERQIVVQSDDVLAAMQGADA